MRSQLAKLFALVTVLLAIAGSAVFAWQQRPLSVNGTKQPAMSEILLPSVAGDVLFSHPAHGSARCVDCHHPVGSNKSYQRCKDCHRPGGGRLLGAQAAMHQTCVGCHAELMKNKKPAPSRRCSSCHEARE